MGVFKQAKDMYKLQKEAKAIKKELANIHIEAEEDGVIVTINAEMEVMNVQISDEAAQNKIQLQKSLLKAFNKGLKKAQEIAAEKMKGVMSMMGMGQDTKEETPEA